jgi:fucose permease
MSPQLRLKISLYINYFVFAILLNSVGIVILKSIQNYNVDEVAASALELFKDLPIAIVSFLIASFLPKIGYKKSMLIALALVTLGCLWMWQGNSFGSAKILFALVGIAFALIKVSVYAMIGELVTDEKEHSGLMSSIEGVFMFGIASSSFIFPFFNDDTVPSSWLNVYLLLAFLCVLAFGFLWATPFQESQIDTQESLARSFSGMLSLLVTILVMVFVVSAFLFVMIEQGIMTWLPTFNKEVIRLSTNVSIMMASILTISLGVGRLLAGYFSQRFNPFSVLTFCILASILMVALVLPQATKLPALASEINTFSGIPLIGFAFPLVGLFIAPIYPLLNSMILSSMDKKLHSSMTGLIVIFSALGGTLGSRIVGYMFREYGAASGFYFTLLPMILLLISVFILRRLKDKK